jgi:hypothetical protein
MKKAIVFVAVSAFVGFLAMGSIVAADDIVPGQYSQQDQSVMGVGQTMLQMGSQARTLTNAVNLASGAGQSRSSSTGMNLDYQFGSSQSDQSWKMMKSVEDAGVVVGLVPGDCRGDNSSDAYRKQMNQSRNGYMEEKLVSQSDCAEIHPTVK